MFGKGPRAADSPGAPGRPVPYSRGTSGLSQTLCGPGLAGQPVGAELSMHTCLHTGEHVSRIVHLRWESSIGLCLKTGECGRYIHHLKKEKSNPARVSLRNPPGTRVWRTLSQRRPAGSLWGGAPRCRRGDTSAGGRGGGCSQVVPGVRKGRTAS